MREEQLSDRNVSSLDPKSSRKVGLDGASSYRVKSIVAEDLKKLVKGGSITRKRNSYCEGNSMLSSNQ